MKHSLREYEAEALRLPRSTRCARVKRSAMLLFRVAKPRFIGRSPASFFMRVSALHFQTKEHCSRSALLFGFRGRKDYQARNFASGENLLACRWKMPRFHEALSDGFAAKPNRILRVGRAEPGLIRE